MEKDMSKAVATPTKRDEWEIKDDLRAVKRALAVFKDKDRLKDVQDLIKSKKEVEGVLDAVADGNLKEALGIIEN